MKTIIITIKYSSISFIDIIQEILESCRITIFKKLQLVERKNYITGPDARPGPGPARESTKPGPSPARTV